jgi:hypothetical protein
MAWVALEGSRDLTEAETDKFYWIETLENYLRTDIESGEGTFLPGGGGGVVAIEVEAYFREQDGFTSLGLLALFETFSRSAKCFILIIL